MARGGFERPPLWAVIVLLVVVLAVGGEVLYSNAHPPKDPVSAAQLQREDALARAAAASDSAAAKAAATPVVAILGDSYTAASENGHDGYVWPLGRSFGWRVTQFGQGGTGYVNPGPPERHETTFINRVPAVVAIKPNIVIVEGGGNDVDRGTCNIQQPATKVFTALRTALPAAKIIAVTSVHGPKAGFSAAVFEQCAAAITAAARPLKIPVVDPIALGWFTDENPADFVDGIHLTQLSYVRYAQLLGDQLRKIGV